jgi:hypothetical protein
MTLIGAIFLFGMGQNLIFINLLRAAHDFDSLLELFLVGLFKSAPLLLTLVFLWRHYGELFHSYASEQWVLRERDVYQPIPQSPGALA